MVKIRTLLIGLAYLIALSGAAPIYPFLDPLPRLLLSAALPAGLLFDRRRSYPVRPAIATSVSLVLFLYYAAQLSMAEVGGPLVNMLGLLLAVRLLTEKSPRHLLQIYLLAIFCLASSSLLTLGGMFFLYLVVLVFGVTISLVLLSFYLTDPGLVLNRSRLLLVLRFALLLPAVSLVLMLLFFTILPRTQHPLWRFMNQPERATAGFTDQVSPGEVAGVAGVEDVAFRAEGQQLPRQDLYWRGIVLNRMEGKDWRRQLPIPDETLPQAAQGTVEYLVYPEPGRSGYLMGPDHPVDHGDIRATLSPDRVLRAPKPLERRIKYRVAGLPGGVIPAAEIDAPFYLVLPETVPERVRELAERVQQGAGTAVEKVERLAAEFRSRNLLYSDRDLPLTDTPVETFLFESKAGYCEYFASSYALLLRLMGVPSRLVGGYLGGEYNDLGGYYLVTEARAHVWVEAFLPDRGWVRVDPSRLASNAATALEGGRAARLGPVGRLIDGMRYLWNQAVITYDFEQQLRLLRRANDRLRSVSFDLEPSSLLPWFGLGLLPVLLLFLGRRKAWRISPEERLLRHFLSLVEKRYGKRVEVGERGLQSLAAEVGDPLCSEFVTLYNGAVFRDRPLSEAERRRLHELLRELRRIG